MVWSPRRQVGCCLIRSRGISYLAVNVSDPSQLCASINVSQIKLVSVKLAMKYMKRVSAALETVGGGPEEEELIVQGVRFAFRVHQVILGCSTTGFFPLDFKGTLSY